MFPSVAVELFTVHKAKGLIFCISSEGGEIRVFRCKKKPFLVHKVSLGSITKLWKKMFSWSVRHIYVVTADILLIMLQDFRFRLMDLGSVIDKNFKLFSSYDYATFEFKPALKEDFFYKWNRLNPYHQHYDRELARVYYDLRSDLDTLNGEYDMPVGEDNDTIIEETESDSQQSGASEMQRLRRKSWDDKELFCKPAVISKVEMNPDDPIEIGTVRIWILHLDGFQYEIEYNRSRKEFLLKDNRVNWIGNYFVLRKKREKARKKTRTKVKLGDLLHPEEENMHKQITLEGSLSDKLKSQNQLSSEAAPVHKPRSDQADSIGQPIRPNEAPEERPMRISQSQSEKQLDMGDDSSRDKQYKSEKTASQRVNGVLDVAHENGQTPSKEAREGEEDMLLYDSRTPSEVIYRNISNMTMQQTEYLDPKPGEKRSLVTSELVQQDQAQPLFKKKDREEPDKWSQQAQDDFSKKSLRDMMKESLKSAREFSRLSVKADSVKRHSSDLLSNFSESESESTKNKKLQTSKRKTVVVSGLAPKIAFQAGGQQFRRKSSSKMKTRSKERVSDLVFKGFLKMNKEENSFKKMEESQSDIILSGIDKTKKKPFLKSSINQL